MANIDAIGLFDVLPLPAILSVLSTLFGLTGPALGFGSFLGTGGDFGFEDDATGVGDDARSIGVSFFGFDFAGDVKRSASVASVLGFL